jgi:Ca-activated chloride channel family protein
VTQIVLLAVLALGAMGISAQKLGGFGYLWWTADQQGFRLYRERKFSEAADVFADPLWQGTAAYATGRYEESAETFARLPDATGFFNRGNALVKAREYGAAIQSYELAVRENPDWSEAIDNLALARHIQAYLIRSREQSDTGDERELSADGFKFDNTGDNGREMVISNESAMEVQSAEKWMRSVNTEMVDFLNTRFALEQARSEHSGGGQ